MNATILLVATAPKAEISTIGYTIGAILALLIFGYLIYSLIKPEKF